MAEKSEELQGRLNEFLDKAVRAKVSREEEEKRRVEGPKLFADNFAAVSATKIRPVLEKACEPWLKRGLPAKVVVNVDSPSPSVSLNVEPNPDMEARLVYSGRLDDCSIIASRHFGRYAGEAIEQFGLNDITPEIVQSHVDDFISEVIRLGGQ